MNNVQIYYMTLLAIYDEGQSDTNLLEILTKAANDYETPTKVRNFIESAMKTFDVK